MKAPPADLRGIMSLRELMAKKFPPFPVLDAYVDTHGRYRAWCDYCQREHVHTPIGGPHPPHCRSHASPYWPDGYTLHVVESLQQRSCEMHVP